MACKKVNLMLLNMIINQFNFSIKLNTQHVNGMTHFDKYMYCYQVLQSSVKRRFKGKQRRSFLTNNRPENVSFKPKKKKEFCKEGHLVYFLVLWHIHLFHIKLLWGNHILSTLCMQHWWRSSQAAAKLQEQQLFVKQNMNTVCML